MIATQNLRPTLIEIYHEGHGYNALNVNISPRTSGRAKRAPKNNLEFELRWMVSYHGSDWSIHPIIIEFAHATMVSKYTHLSQLIIDTGMKGNNALVGVCSEAVTKIVSAEYKKKVFRQETEGRYNFIIQT